MKPLNILLVAGEKSGDQLAAELARAITIRLEERGDSLRPLFWGLGGPAMKQEGVEILEDLTDQAVVGLFEAVQKYGYYKRIFDHLLRVTLAEQPTAVILVDFSGFNRRFAAALRRCAHKSLGPFRNWRPKIFYYVSPQVWASRPGRAKTLERDIDLLLSIFPFEKAWYAKHYPKLKVRYVGHPMVDRLSRFCEGLPETKKPNRPPRILLLPGSRRSELERHLPVMLDAASRLQSEWNATLSMVVPGENMSILAEEHLKTFPSLRIHWHKQGLHTQLGKVDLAIASTGTVTLECAFFGVPTITLYRTSPSTYWLARSIIQVPHIAMPNLLAGKAVYPELIQDAASADSICEQANRLLSDPAERQRMAEELKRIRISLGQGGAAMHAADAILEALPAALHERM